MLTTSRKRLAAAQSLAASLRRMIAERTDIRALHGAWVLTTRVINPELDFDFRLLPPEMILPIGLELRTAVGNLFDDILGTPLSAHSCARLRLPGRCMGLCRARSL